MRETVERFGALTTLVNNAGVLHRASLADETPAGFEGSWRFNCLGPFLGNACGTGTSARGRRGGHRQHLQHRCHAGVPKPRRIRFVQMGAPRPHPGRRRRACAIGHQGQRRFPRAHRDAHARRGDAGATGGARARSDESASRQRSPTRSRFWSPIRRRSSPARNSSSTVDRSCRLDEPDGQDSFGGNHRRRPGWARAGNLPAQGRLSATSPSSTARTASAAPGGSTPIRDWRVTSSRTCTRTRST